MTSQAEIIKTDMEFMDIPRTGLKVSRVAIGTWAIGGWMWGGTNEAESIATIRAAIDHGINVVDTAPAYGFGRSEEIVGKAVAHARSNVIIATKVGLEWQGGKVFRNASRTRIMREIEELITPSANRLHRCLSGSLAGPIGRDRRDRRGDVRAVQPGEDSRHRSEQFFSRPNEPVSSRGATARAAAPLQSLRARS